MLNTHKRPTADKAKEKRESIAESLSKFTHFKLLIISFLLVIGLLPGLFGLVAVYNKSKYDAVIVKIADLYHDSGYIYAQVIPELIANDEKKIAGISDCAECGFAGRDGAGELHTRYRRRPTAPTRWRLHDGFRRNPGPES